MNTDNIEQLLRSAPQVTPPSGLKERLIREIPMREQDAGSHKPIPRPSKGGWLRRWWPALVPGAISAACAVVLTAEQGTIRGLKANIQTLQQAPVPESIETQPTNGTAAADMSADAEQEINRLKEVAERLRAEIGELQGLQTTNTTLRAQLAAPAENVLTKEDAEALAKAKERAQSIACVNNLKQFGVAVRVWNLDNNGSNPPTVLSMSNELSTPKILVCPADTMHQAATDWSSFSMANCSYEFLVSDEKDVDREPLRVSVRCPIHGHIGLCDGSVMMRVAKEHPDWLVERDGKVYYESGRNTSPPLRQNPATPGSGPNSSGNMTEEQKRIFRERYGIPQPNGAAPQ